MAIGSSLGITLPTQGGNTNTWGTDLNTELQKIIDAVEAQVPISAVDFSSDLAAGGNGVTGLKLTSYAAQGSNPSDLRSVFFTSAGEFAIRDGANNVVTLTSGGSLNNASSGGITDTGGTYGTSGIALDWNGTKYDFLDGSGTYGDVRANKFELNDNVANSVTIDVPTVSASYNLTLPSAVATSAGLFLQSDASGNTSWSNNTSQDITISGSARYKHGEFTKNISAWQGVGLTSGGALVEPGYSTGSAGKWEASSGSDIIVFPIELDTGERLKSVTVNFSGGSTGAKDLHVYEVDSAGNSTTLGTQSSTTSGAGSVTVSGLTNTTADGDSITARFECADGAAEVYSCEVVYDYP